MNNRILGMARLLVATTAVAILPAAISAGTQPGPPVVHAQNDPLPAVSPGYHIEVYAHVAEPMKLSFGRDGSLFVGRQPGNRIQKITWGGQQVAKFGPPQVDPDAVLVDVNGRISGVRNAVLVGGGGVLAAIFPDQTSSVIFNSGFADVDDMKFDRHGRLVFSDDNPRVLATTGGPPAELFATPSRPGSIAIEENNRIFVALADGTIKVYRPDGSLLDDSFASGLDGLDTYLAFGPGARGFGRSLYVLNGNTLLRFDHKGISQVIGTGFSIGPSSGTGFVFGPDNALYISDYASQRMLRISRRERPRINAE